MSKKFQKAYTIIEMVTVIAIIIVMVTVLATLDKPQRNFALQRSVYSFSAAARRIQEMSMSIATVKVGEGEIVPLGGYGIELASDTQDDKNKTFHLYYNQLDESLDYQSGEQILTGSKIKYENGQYSSYIFEDNVYVGLIEGITVDGSPVNSITKLNIVFYPPDPKIVMYAEYGTASQTELRSAIIKLKMTGNDSIARMMEINKLGLISVDQGNTKDE